MQTINSPRGTRDILPAQAVIWNRVKAAAEKVALDMGYQPITVPTFEEAKLFSRALGDTTDIQEKELFLVRGVRSDSASEQYALRPEGTAGIVRAYVQNGMRVMPQPLKLYSIINNFRYDRPQKGRYREFWQFDLEYFGDTGPFADAWVIYSTWRFFKELGIDNLELKLNSLGDQEEREMYKKQLIGYYEPLKESLSEDARRRLHENPLRVFDSKEAADIAAREGAPRLEEAFGPESAAHFAAVQSYLEVWDIPYVLDPFLVRGLDYYSQTAFEWTVKTEGGQQASLGGGGRYDGLIPQLGGLPTGAVGVALGLDRVIEEMERQGLSDAIKAQPPLAYVVAADNESIGAALAIVDILLDANISLDCNFSKKSIGAQLKAAGKSDAAYAVILGGDEMKAMEAVIKNLKTGDQRSVLIEDLSAVLLGNA